MTEDEEEAGLMRRREEAYYGLTQSVGCDGLNSDAFAEMWPVADGDDKSWHAADQPAVLDAFVNGPQRPAGDDCDETKRIARQSSGCLEPAQETRCVVSELRRNRQGVVDSQAIRKNAGKKIKQPSGGWLKGQCCLGHHHCP